MKRFRSWLKLFFSRLKLADIPNYLAILAAVILGTLRAFGRPFGTVEGVILFILGLFAASILIDRHRQDEFREKVFSLAEGKKSVSDFLQNLGDLPPLEKRLHDASEIWISGLTMANFFMRYRKLIEGLLKRGVKIRCLIAPNEGWLVGYIHEFLGSASLEAESSQYHHAVNLSLNILRKWCADFDTIECRTLTVMPSHNLLIINPEGAGGEAQVHLNIYNQDTDRNPVFLVRRFDSPENFTLFKNEFKELWDNSTSIPGQAIDKNLLGPDEVKERRIPGKGLSAEHFTGD
ncbi:MAG TPA: hypothetical protein VF297_03810 [Pyrinomonadaceae bacterium]